MYIVFILQFRTSFFLHEHHDSFLSKSIKFDITGIKIDRCIYVVISINSNPFLEKVSSKISKILVQKYPVYRLFV